MISQVQEMLYIEKGGDAQLADELDAYNPLIPNGTELVATLMFEIDDPDRRTKLLYQLGGVEETIYIQVGDTKISAQWEDDVDRTKKDGKTSAVHFLRFTFSKDLSVEFVKEGAQIILGIDHPNYPHMVKLQPTTLATLALGFD
jgi:hypothetical protein